MAKPLEKIKAVELRNQGESIKFIAKTLNVSPGTVSLWCKNVKLSKDQISVLEKRYRDPHYGKRLEYSLSQQRKRLEKIERLKAEGIQDIAKLSQRELFLVGVALYWAEGFKKDSQAGLSNIDPAMIKLYIRWLFDCFGYLPKDLSIRISLNVNHKERIKEVEHYWSDITGIPSDLFQKPFYQTVQWKKTYENPNEYYGILRVKVKKSTDFLRKINGWIEGLKLNT